MNRHERLYVIERMLQGKRAVPIAEFLELLEISPATFKRDLAYLRDRLNAPIVWDPVAGGYRFEKAVGDGARHELPGLWFSGGALFALIAAQKLLVDIDPGVLATHVAPLQARLSALLASTGHAASEVHRRVRLLSMARRQVEPRNFAEMASALFSRHRIVVEHWSRQRDDVSTRVLSPQRLVYYRDNWYLDAWCHLRGGLRSFAAETLRHVVVRHEPALEIDDDALDAHYAAAFGIFAGTPTNIASLLFSAERARWVRQETWHPAQRGEDLPDGRYRLRVPYSDERELLMDILRQGAHVFVEEPLTLRHRVKAEIEAVSQKYSGD